MIAWLLKKFPWIAALALALTFVLLCFAVDRGHKVSLGGPQGFVFEAPAPKTAALKSEKPVKKAQP